MDIPIYISNYNTSFNVKYMSIFKELEEKINGRVIIKDEIEDYTDEIEDYTIEELKTIISTLYIYELNSVFFLQDTVISPLLANRMNKVVDELCDLNTRFRDLYRKYTFYNKDLIVKDDNDDDDVSDYKQSSKNYIEMFDDVRDMMFFSENVFYLTHQFICNISNNDIINDTLLDEMDKELSKLFNFR